LIRGGVPADRVAVVCPALERWRAPLETALSTLGVPHAVEDRLRLGQTAFGHALLSVLRFVWLDGTRKDLFAFLRSPFSGLTRAGRGGGDSGGPRRRARAGDGTRRGGGRAGPGRGARPHARAHARVRCRLRPRPGGGEPPAPRPGLAVPRRRAAARARAQARAAGRGIT